MNIGTDREGNDYNDFGVRNNSDIIPTTHPINNKENENELIPETATCRICRGEATLDDPLFHPCKCKGSIKYLHEHCLLEWIGARNLDISKPGKSVECDICHYPFQFKTTYDSNMPDKIPFSLLLVNFFYNIYGSVHRIFTMFLLVILLSIGVPLSWNIFGKFYTFLLDGELPYHGSLLKSAIFGYERNVPDNYSFKDVVVALAYNQQFSLWQIVFTVVLHLALYFQYDMIVREDVFSKMVFHKIGPNLSIEVLKNRLKEKFPMMDDTMLEHIAKVMAERELRRNDGANQPDQDPEVLLNQNFENNQNDNDDNEDSEDSDDAEFVPDDTASHNDSDDSLNSLDGEEHMRQEVNEGVNGENFHLENPLDDLMNRHAQNHFDNLLDQQRNININRADMPFLGAQPMQPLNDNVIINELPRGAQVPRVPQGLRAPQAQPDVPVLDNEQPQEPAANAFPAAGLDGMQDENLQGQQQIGPLLINLQLKLVNIFIYFAIGVLFSSLYILVAYFLPTVVGYVLLWAYTKLFLLGYRSMSYLYYLSKFDIIYELSLIKIPGFKYIVTWIGQYVVNPVNYYISSYNNNTMRGSTLVRAFPAFTTYLTTVFVICIASEVIAKGFGRENGMTNRTRRFVFQLLFALKCTFKVFTLFFIELAGFPILAGAMLDFSLFASILGEITDIVWIPSISIVWYQNEMLYWMIGTLYMYWFAKYIGMIRQHIIRPGVLFFIRSPDDPNTKILHDSLIHPMSIQLSRLCLSMFIYAVFIVIGFGFHTRLLFPIILKSKMLNTPSIFLNGNFFNKFTMLIVFYFTKRIIEANPNVKLIVREYWSNIFQASSKKLRLSSFILGTDYASERGHILYRNIFYRLFSARKAQWSNPDLYSSPKTYSQAKESFKQNSSIHAYFIPDGVLMRVPSSDIVSRNYVQTMFVPVTKTDKLLKPLDLERVKEKNKKNAGEFGYLDQQNTDFDEYFICYVPPNFRFRYISLILLMWFFASILILCTSIIAQYICNTMTVVLVLLPAKLFNFEDLYETSKEVILLSYKQMNIQYVCVGAVIMSFMLDYYKNHELSRFFFDEHIINDNDDGHVPNEQNEHNVDENVNQNEVQAQNLPRPALEDLIFENFISKYVIAPILLCGLGVVDYFLFGFEMSNIVRVCIEYLNFVMFNKPINIINTFGDVYSKLYFFINFWFVSSIIIRCLRLAISIRDNENRRFLQVVKQQWIIIVRPYLKFVGKCYLILFVLVVISTVLEYAMNFNNYKSILDTLIFMIVERLRYESRNIPWTLAQHLMFGAIIMVIVTYIASVLSSAIQKWFASSVQNVKDEVYAKGRSLENFALNTTGTD